MFLDGKTLAEFSNLVSTNCLDFLRVGAAQRRVVAIIRQQPVSFRSLQQMAELVKEHQNPNLPRVWTKSSNPRDVRLGFGSCTSIEGTILIDRDFLEQAIRCFGPVIKNTGNGTRHAYAN